MNAFAGLYLTGNTTPVIAPNAAAGQAITGMTAMTADSHGDATITTTAADGKLNLSPGRRYKLEVHATLETEDVSGTTASDIGNVVLELHADGTVIAGAKQRMNMQAFDRPQHFSIGTIYEVAADVDGDRVAITAVVRGEDASGFDVTVSECQLLAIALD